MKRLLVPALIALASSLPAQGGSDDAPATRRQPEAPGFQQQVDDVFGTIIAALTHYPFYNIAGWFGLDTSPHLLGHDDGQPRIEGNRLLPEGGARLARLAPGGRWVATASTGGVIQVWTTQGKQVVTLPRLSGAEVVDVAFHPDLGSFREKGELLTVQADDTLTIWSLRTEVPEHVPGEPVRAGTTTAEAVLTLDEAPGSVQHVLYSPEGRWIATGSDDGRVRLFDEHGAVATTMEGHGEGVVAIAFADDETLVSLGADGRGQLWQAPEEDAGNWIRTSYLEPTEGARLSGLALVAGDVGIAAAIQDDGAVVVHELPDGTRKGVIPAGEAVVSVDTVDTEEGEALEVLRIDGSRSRFLVDDLAPVAEAPAAVEDLGGAIAIHPADEPIHSGYALFPGNNASQPRLRPLDPDTDREYVFTVTGALKEASFSDDGTRLVTLTEEGNVRVLDWYQRGPDGGLVKTELPFVVLWLVAGAVLFTLYMRFVNLRMFKHALQVVRGKFSNPEDQGEVSHFQALSSALSATVGLGNIAGVAIAVSIGGPGATFWMIIAGLLGMTLKFTECTLGQHFRKIDDQGRVSGGPMHYLKDGLARLHLKPLGVLLALVFTIFCLGGSLAGGNAFQVNQSLGVLQDQVPWFEGRGWVYGVALAFFVGIVIIGGIKRIAQTAEKIVPTMCGLYILAALLIIGAHITEVPAAFGTIFGNALSGDAMYGGAVGALIYGFQRAAFSNEAGIGSASIAHSAARTPYAVREGIVALLEPFIDTVLVCTMTALVIVITGVYDPHGPHAELVVGSEGATLTLRAFESVGFVGIWFQHVLTAAVVLFAFSTMISWSYYGERCWTNLFGQGSSLWYKLLFLAFVVLGSIVQATNVLEFGDVMILLMAFPNILGLYFLGHIVRRDLRDYEHKLGAGGMPTYK